MHLAAESIPGAEKPGAVNVSIALKTSLYFPEAEGSAPLILKSTIEHSPDSLPSTSHPHNLFL
jgi:hypothetical protein